MSPPYKISFLAPPGLNVLSVHPHRLTTSNNPSVPQTFLDAIAVRHAVFGLEQKCPADEEIDADDTVSWHWVIYADGSVPAATIRLIPAQAHANADDEKAVGGPKYEGSRLWDHEEPYLVIGRLATRKEFRGRGYARVLVEEALRWAAGHAGDMVADWNDGDGKRMEWKGLLLLHAQMYLEKWYEGIGWRTDEGMGVWDEAEIQHVGMWKRVELRGSGGPRHASASVDL